MTKAPWKSAFVAALFALHPLHVESVAWVAERKDVLSTFFWMLTLVSYVHYVERPRLRTYLPVFTFFALGLMAKPMLVTLPFVLLLLDYWPLQRLEQKKAVSETRTDPKKSLSVNRRKSRTGETPPVEACANGGMPAAHKYGWARVRPLLIEKIPFFALISLFSVLTYIAEGKTAWHLPLRIWISNALVSYVIYIGKMIWPAKLAVFYPHPGLWPFWQAAGAAFLLVAITGTVILMTKRFPYLAFGWLWFSGTLVPVIGIVQISDFGRADRYTYIPLIGLFVMIVWGVPEIFKSWRYYNEGLVVLSALILFSLSILTWRQVGYWRTSLTLFDHTLEITSHNFHIYNERGATYTKLGNYNLAIKDYDEAIKINPKFAGAYDNRGATYAMIGNHRCAISDYDKAVEVDSHYANAYYNRGTSYAALGDYRQAISDYDRAIEINPNFPAAYINQGFVYLKLGNPKRAIKDYDKAIGINPEIAHVYHHRGMAYAELGNNDQAVLDYGRAIEIDPGYADAYYDRGTAYFIVGNYTQAISDYDRAIETNPKLAQAYSNRGLAYSGLGSYEQAISDYDRAIEIHPDYASIYYNRAVAHVGLGHNDQAVQDLKTAARLNNEDAQNSLRAMGISW